MRSLAVALIVAAVALLPGPASAADTTTIDQDATKYALLIRWINPALTARDAYAVAWWTVYISRAFGLDPRLMISVIWTESRFRHTAVSSRGAVGFGQVLPSTARGLGINPYDPLHNLWATARLLWGHYMEFRNWRLALAAYNAGSSAVRRYGGIPPYEETRRYVSLVLARYTAIVRAGW